jgi:hypothetical protein
MFTNTPSDRVQLVGLGELLNPAKCMICGSGNCEQGYARLGVWYDFEGEQYLCRTCVVQVAELFNCLTPEEAEHQHEQASAIANENLQLRTELGVANERLSVFDAAIRGIVDSDSGSDRSNVYVDHEAGVIRRNANAMDEPLTYPAGSTDTEPVESVKGRDSAGTDESELQHDAERAIPSL